MYNIRFLCLLPALMCAVMLPVACSNGGGQSADFSSWRKAGLYFTNPYDGQKEVPLHALVVLQFSDPVTSTPEEIKDQVTWTSADGGNVDFSVNITEDRRSLVLVPDSDENFEPHTDDCLKPATQYTVSAQGLKTAIGGVEFPEGGISFTTRAAVQGAKDQITANGYKGKPFQVARMIPDGQNLQFMDFSTIRLQFTQPVDKSTVKYGDTVVLEDDQGSVVKANVITSGSYMSIDPDPEGEYLDPSATYHLRLTGEIQSITGTALTPGDYSDLPLHPRNSASPEGERTVLVSKTPVSDDLEDNRCADDCRYTSPLTGMPINCVPVKAVLLGDTGNNTQLTRDVYAELAYAPDYPDPDPLPLRIPRGSLLTGTNIEVKIGGKVPAGFETKDISVEFVSDAGGYLMLNPYSDDAEAPRHIRIFMDVAMNTAGAEANGALSQDLLHVELVGTSIVENGVMIINALGVIEPRLLGVESAYGILSLHLESYYDQENAPPMEPDTTAPAVQSWVPGGQTQAEATENAKEIRPGDPIIVNFTEPLDRNSVQAEIDRGMLTLNGGGNFSWYLDGGTLVLRPVGGLEYGASYDLVIPMTVTDLAGNGLSENFSRSFTMPAYASGDARSPIVLTAYPGYPCANTVGTDASLLTTDDRGNTYQGRVIGGDLSDSDGDGMDDPLPVMDLPANRPIRVQFSQVMDTTTITAGGSFVVEQSTDGGTTWTNVPGRLEKQPRRMQFYPDTPWQDGVLYRYILRSSQIKDESGNPLQTNLLEAPEPTDAGPDLVNYFRGGPETDSVFLELRNLPTIDVNSNFAYDGEEGPPDENSGPVTDFVDVSDDPLYSDVVESGNYIIEENSAMLKIGEVTLAEAYFGDHDAGEEKSEDFLWYTHALNAEVVGPAPYEGFDDDYRNSGKPAVKVNVYPTRLVGANMDMYIELIGWSWIWIDAPTGPLDLRIRYQEDENGDRTQLITGWIKDTPQGPVFEIPVDVYLDAPYLEPALYGAGGTSMLFTHNLNSYEFTLPLRGRIIFLEDGRMVIRVINTEPVDIDVEAGINILPALLGDIIKIDLQIPRGGNFLNYMKLPIKE